MAYRTARAQFVLLLLMVWTGAYAAEDEKGEPAIPRIPMPQQVYELLGDAIHCYDWKKHGREEYQKENLAALGHLRTVPWPDFGKLEWIHVCRSGDKERRLRFWHLPVKGDSLVLLLPNFTERRVPRGAFSEIEVADYAVDLSELVKYVQGRDPEKKRPWDFTFIRDRGTSGLPYYGGVFLLHHAYAAAYLGRSDEAKGLVHEAFRQRRLSLKSTYNEGAWQSFWRGIKLLEQGSPRAIVLAQWQETLRIYGHSRYRQQLLDLVGQLKAQVQQDGALRATEVDEPDRLPQDERIAYYLGRFPDVRGQQFCQPGQCQVLRMGERTKFSDAIIKIGRPAVPALIEHLSDRRVTRSIGYRRHFDSSRTVLRVQDVAVACIQKILDIPFYRRSSSSAYLSNERPGRRQKVVAEIRAWWGQFGHKSPLEGHLGRLTPGDFATLRKIEAISREAIDSVAALKRWAAELDASHLPAVAEALAKRGDLSLLPAVREMMRDKGGSNSSGCVRLMLRYGSSEDYRFLRDAAQKEIAAGAERNSPSICGAVSGSAESSENPLVVPILVDLLCMRRITGSRGIRGGRDSIGFSRADTCMEALIRLTGHDEGYRPERPKEERYAAIHRWIVWWEKEGKVEYVRNHPEVTGVLASEGEPITDVDAKALPAMVRVAHHDSRVPITYDVPRDSMAALVQAGDAKAKRHDDGEIRCRFVSANAPTKWFESARPVLAEGTTATGSLLGPLNRVGRPASAPGEPKGRVQPRRSGRRPSVHDVKRTVETAIQGGALRFEDARVRLTDHTGHTWFLSDDDMRLLPGEAKRQMQAVARDGRISLSGAQLLLVDPIGRIWLVPDADRQLLLGYDPRSREWIERRCLPPDSRSYYNDEDPRVSKCAMTGPAFQTRLGHLCCADTIGVHTLIGRRWSFQPFFVRNHTENRWHGNVKSFNRPRFVEDQEGNLYAWAEWGLGDRAGTIGYWLFDGRQWRNVDVVERLTRVIPRGLDEQWLISNRWQLSLLRDRELLTGEQVQKALCPNIRFTTASYVCTGSHGATYLSLWGVTILAPLRKVRCRALMLRPRGMAVDLGDRATAFFSRTGIRRTLVGPDGWLWGATSRGLEGMAPDGTDFLVLPHTDRLARPRLRCFDGGGNLYLHGSRQMWRLDLDAARAQRVATDPQLPAMRVRIADQAWPDSLGRMWCTWYAGGSPLAVFDGKMWRTLPDAPFGRKSGEPDGAIAVFPGTNGSMVFVGRERGFHLLDTQGWATAKSAQELAIRHGYRLGRALPYPPQPSARFYHHLMSDPKGRIWWAHWFHGWGVVENGKAIDGKASSLDIGPNRERVLSVLTPIGDGTRVLAGDEDGRATIVDVVEGRIVKCGDSPVRVSERPPDGWRRNVFRDSRDRVWVMAQNGSEAIGPTGERVASHKGWLSLEDRQHGLWFNVRQGYRASVVRVATDGHEARLEIPDLHEHASMAQAPDGTVWALTDASLIRIRDDGQQLSVVERYRLRIGWPDHIWCDPAGRVWHLHHDPEDGTRRYLIRYATASTLH